MFSEYTYIYFFVTSSIKKTTSRDHEVDINITINQRATIK